MVNVKKYIDGVYKWGILVGGGTMLTYYGLEQVGFDPNLAFFIPASEFVKNYISLGNLRPKRYW